MDETPEFDLIAIGDITTDAFIRIQKASVYYDDITNEEKVCLTNGGKIPYEFAKVLAGVGNSANAAVSATRLGLKTSLVTDIGDDDNAEEILDALEHNGVNRTFVRVHHGKASNYHYVLWYKDERTILIKHEEYPYTLPDLGNPRWIYFSSVGENSLEYHHDIARFVREHPTTQLAFQPGTMQIKLGYETLKELYELSHVFFCNKEEARVILKTQEDRGAILAKMLADLGPKIVVVTDGAHGAYMFDGQALWSIPAYPDQNPPYERTGAGDSFSSTFTSALALGKSVEEAFVWGQINSRNVIQYVGAQEGLLTREEIEHRFAHKPEGYTPQRVEI